MVLIYIYFALFLPVTDLFTAYEKEIDATLRKLYTFDKIEYRDISYSLGEYKEIIIENTLSGYLFIAEIETCNLGGCQIKDLSINVDTESFDMLVVLNPSKEIRSIKILDYYSDYGYEITSRKYLKKFIGKPICDFSRKIDGIDAISGATISCTSLENSLSFLCEQ